MKDNQFYCVKCRKAVAVAAGDISLVSLKNKKRRSGKMPALKAHCRMCNTNLTKFVKEASVKKLGGKYKKSRSKKRSKKRRSRSRK
jgi:hypothetical protein